MEVFAVDSKLLTLDRPLPYSLYINSSAIDGKAHFVRVVKDSSVLQDREVEELLKKYHQLYVAESERGKFLDSLCQSPKLSLEEKSRILKDHALLHLERLYEPHLDLNRASQALEGCRDVAEGLVSVVKDQSVVELQKLIGNLSFHDFYTFDHSINVAMYSILIARLLHPEASPQELLQAGMGGLLHDIGKIQIPSGIINKPGKLSAKEFEKIQKHPELGVAFLSSPGLTLPPQVERSILLRIVLEHHENVDGSGYPMKRTEAEIHELARVTAVADFYDAITTKRSYAETLSPGEALALMAKAQGKKLDPRVFEKFAAHALRFIEMPVVRFQLPPNYDPCQPQRKLPLQEDFGKVLRKY
jgi:HD-GYP domain-containing protein (c-di-GMP phosphodiesterase class II)